jgi:hypothetical protein
MGAVARGDRTALAAATHRARPVTLAEAQTVEVLGALAPLLPGGALRRGSVLGVRGVAATSLALALAAKPSQAGSWVGALGLPDLGLLAALEAGVALERLLLVAAPPSVSWPSVAATLLDGVDVLLARSPQRCRPGDARRLQARVRDRGAVLCLLGATDSFEVDVALTAHEVAWHGLGQGAGHLQARQVRVQANGRRAAAQPRHAELWLPDPAGAIEASVPAAEVVPLRGA